MVVADMSFTQSYRYIEMSERPYIGNEVRVTSLAHQKNLIPAQWLDSWFHYDTFIGGMDLSYASRCKVSGVKEGSLSALESLRLHVMLDEQKIIILSYCRCSWGWNEKDKREVGRRLSRILKNSSKYHKSRRSNSHVGVSIIGFESSRHR